jgi:prepilin-type processing-associated H-X9-DG protein
MSVRSRMRPSLGFTMVELLAVVAVTALLLGALLPVVRRVGERARCVQCLSNLRSMGQAVALYAAVNKGQFPLSSHAAGSVVGLTAWLQTLQEHGAGPEIRLCPSDPDARSKSTSYATNEHFEPLSAGVDFNPVTKASLPGGRTVAYRRLSIVPRPAAAIYAYEPQGVGTIDHLHTHQILSVEALQRSVAVTRHDGAANYLFADGHVATWAWSDLSASFSPPRQNPFDPATARVAP